MTETPTQRLARLDHAHVWHPFTPMRQWRAEPPLIIERGEGPYLIDTDGRRFIDGVSSLWCNVHGHRVKELDDAVRDQLDRIAHTTLLGLASPPSIELAAMLAERAPGELNKVFYSDAGATAVEVAFKMAVGYWYHQGKPAKHKFIGLAEAYHGDTTGAMSVGYSELFHRPFLPMVFEVRSFAHPDAPRASQQVRHAAAALRGSGESNAPPRDVWPSEDPHLADVLTDHCLADLERLLEAHAHETAAIALEPVMQGAAGMIPQPAGFVAGVAKLAKQYDVLLIADEVAVGFGRTGKLFAVEHEHVQPDLLCLAKGITGGYLPLAATLVSDRIDAAFTGELSDRRTLYHGHTYTGNPLACAVAIASLKRLESTRLLDHVNASAELIARKLDALRDCNHVLDIRQRGVMVGIELCKDRRAKGGLSGGEPFDFSKRTGAALCMAMREKGLIVRPLGDVIVLMPIPAMAHDVLAEMMDIVVETVRGWRVG